MANYRGYLQDNNSNNLYIEDVYSTNETKTNKVWIDGKPIYRKVSEIGDLAANIEHSINVNISNLDTMVDMRGFSSIPSNNFSVLQIVKVIIVSMIKDKTSYYSSQDRVQLDYM